MFDKVNEGSWGRRQAIQRETSQKWNRIVQLRTVVEVSGAGAGGWTVS
jgi:hypothetical protein